MYSIARAYPTETAARAAVEDLRSEGVGKSEITLCLSSAADSADAIGADALASGPALRRMSDRAASQMVEAARAGQPVVAVQAQFGASARIESILDRNDPVELPDPGGRLSELAWDDAAPLSSALRMPPLSRTRPNPTLSSGLTFGGIKQLTSPHYSVFGSGLSDNPTPLSSMFGMKPLSGGASSKNSSFGLPLLSKKPFKGPTLSNNPAPLSSMFGMPTLTRRD